MFLIAGLAKDMTGTCGDRVTGQDDMALIIRVATHPRHDLRGLGLSQFGDHFCGAAITT